MYYFLNLQQWCNRIKKPPNLLCACILARNPGYGTSYSAAIELVNNEKNKVKAIKEAFITFLTG